ncbi:MAG: flagellar motor protein MotB [Steroidobacteraceae bacterium]
MADDKKRPIIIVKRKAHGGGHHGGAWKVAYADFVTAMMAFFMVMWLVASVSKEQRAAIFEYFKNPSMEQGQSVKAAPGQAGPGGASTSVINMGGGMDAPASSPDITGIGKPVDTTSVDDAKRIAQEAERKQLEALLAELKEAIDKSAALQPFKDQLLLDITPEGLRIQIVDKQNRPMFDLGKSNLKDYTGEILREVAKYLNTVPNRISLSGHTDDKPYAGTRGYTNWELSADRANAARRALLDGGLVQQKIARVVGLASSVLFDRANPFNPINRRISIIVMTKSAEATALSTDAPDVEAAREAIESGAQAAAPAATAPATPAPAAAIAPAPTIAPAVAAPAPGVLPPPVRVSTVSAGAAAKAAEAALSKSAPDGSRAH